MELFKIGFISVKLVDVIDVVLITYIFYRLYKIMRGTVAFQIFVSLLLIIGFSLIAQLINMKAVGWLLSRITEIWVIAFIILFQPEIRRILSTFGRTRFARMFFKFDITESVTEIVDACIEIQKNSWGALIVITRNASLDNIIEKGEVLQAKINKELIISIFNPKSPLHDGAIVMSSNIIEAARCTLPLSETRTFNRRKLGTRHRAGLGITEQTDAVALIISEETQDISIADSGKLELCMNKDDLTDKLKKAMNYKKISKSIKEIIESK